MQTKSGKAIHPIGIGTWLVAGGYEPGPNAPYGGAVAQPDKTEQDLAGIRYSLEKGQNHLDCAEMYGAFYTDEVIGQAIAGMEREDLFIADKLWETSLAADKVRPTVEKMLQKLGTDYLDMLYIHWPWKGWQEAVPQIDELIDAGIVRHFGLSNFTIDDMKRAAQLSKHPVAANQMNYNVLHKTEATEEFREYCKAYDIRIIAYQPVKRKAVLENGTIRTIATVHSATAAQVALAWLLAKGTLPIPKAIQESHIDENLAAVDLELSDEEIATLDRL